MAPPNIVTRQVSVTCSDAFAKDLEQELFGRDPLYVDSVKNRHGLPAYRAVGGGEARREANIDSDNDPKPLKFNRFPHEIKRMIYDCYVKDFEAGQYTKGRVWTVRWGYFTEEKMHTAEIENEACAEDEEPVPLERPLPTPYVMMPEPGESNQRFKIIASNPLLRVDHFARQLALEHYHVLPMRFAGAESGYSMILRRTDILHFPPHWAEHTDIGYIKEGVETTEPAIALLLRAMMPNTSVKLVREAGSEPMGPEAGSGGTSSGIRTNRPKTEPKPETKIKTLAEAILKPGETDRYAPLDARAFPQTLVMNGYTLVHVWRSGMLNALVNASGPRNAGIKRVLLTRSSHCWRVGVPLAIAGAVPPMFRNDRAVIVVDDRLEVPYDGPIEQRISVTTSPKQLEKRLPRGGLEAEACAFLARHGVTVGLARQKSHDGTLHSADGQEVWIRRNLPDAQLDAHEQRLRRQAAFLELPEIASLSRRRQERAVMMFNAVADLTTMP